MRGHLLNPFLTPKRTLPGIKAIPISTRCETRQPNGYLLPTLSLYNLLLTLWRGSIPGISLEILHLLLVQRGRMTLLQIGFGPDEPCFLRLDA